MIRLGILLTVILLSNVLAISQNCDITIRGEIIDHETGEPLEYANIFLEEQIIGVATGHSGDFILENVCPGHIHMRVSHIGCSQQIIYFDLSGDTTITIVMDHHSEVLNEIEISGDAENFGSTHSKSSLGTFEILNNPGEGIGTIVSRIPGVSKLSSGIEVAKPVIHGLYGNRIAVIQNGLNLSGQRWGNDHAPEVTPYGADKVSVIKGVDAVKIGSEGLGAAIVVEDNALVQDPHLHGWAQYGFGTNGRQHDLAFLTKSRLQQLSWKVSGGFNVAGDRKTSEYYLTNTGSKKGFGNLSLHLPISKKGDIQAFYKYFYNELGILRGAHISSLTDLEAAFERDIPFYTNDRFSYNIESPRQKVIHHTLGLKLNFNLGQFSRMSLHSGLQSNQRQEYDVRRGGRSSRPSLDLRLYNQQNTLELTREKSNWVSTFGLNTSWSLNQNDPNTGIGPLIPDYVQTVSGLYSTVKKKIAGWTLEAGGRYDYRYFSVALAPTSSQSMIVRYKHHYHNLMASVGVLNKISDHIKWGVNIGFTQRQPHINELYSQGLHQGVAGIEEGDRNLSSESSLKSIGHLTWHTHHHAFFEFNVYSQRISDYIYLEPTGELRLTIRGAYPVYQYVQNDVTISGFDFNSFVPLTDHYTWFTTAAIVRGNERGGKPLINMPQDRISSGIKFDFESDRLNGHLRVEGEYLFEQKNFPKEVEIIPPPPGYFILNADFEFNFNVFNEDLTCFGRVSNLLNKSYRNYLNRWRYFADEQGINVKLGLRSRF